MKAEVEPRDAPWCVSEEQRSWHAHLRRFCEERVAPGAAERDRDGTFPAALVEQVAGLGVLGLMVPAEHGGQGANLTSLCLALEELARVDCSLAVTVYAQAINSRLLTELGSREQCEVLVSRMVRGEAFVATAITEPGGGSDVAAIATTARPGEGGWVLDGAKEFITNSGTPLTLFLVVFARTVRGADRGGISAFLVPRDAPGVTIGPQYRKMGWRSSDTHPISFEAVRLGDDALLGKEGHGLADVLRFLTWGRIAFSAIAVGVAQGCLDETVRHVRTRRTFGRPLSAHQAVAFAVADMACRTHAARTLVYDACWRHDHDESFAREAAMAKLVSSETANAVAYTATQLHGGTGFVDDSAVARHYRDARALTIGEGTSEIQRILVARHLGLGDGI